MNITAQQLSDHARSIEGSRGYRDSAQAITCADGVTISVQAGECIYSSPRTDFADYYDSVECGFPSVVPSEALLYYCEDLSNPTGTVYGYVPIEIVVDFINEHGGVADETNT